MVIRMVIASTSILSHVTSGNSLATSAAISSHITIAWRCALLLVTTVSSLRGRDWANSKAKRIIRATPVLVMMETSVATSSGRPLWTRPPTPEYSPSEFSHPVQLRTGNMTQRTGDARQNSGRTNVGILIKRLADCQTQTPQRDVVRDIGSADRTKQNGVELAQLIGAVWRHHDAMLPIVVRSPIEILKVQFELTVALGTGFFLRACTPAATTSGPIPSPPMAAIR